MTTAGGCVMAGMTTPSGVTLTATVSGGGPIVVAVTPEEHDAMDGFLQELLFQLNNQCPVSGGTWTFSTFSAGGDAPQLTIGVTNGVCSITWTNTVLRDILGFDANFAGVASATGVGAVRGIWQPRCSVAPALRYTAAPRQTDARQTQGPTGVVVERVGNARYRHLNVGWSHVPMHKVWKGDELVANESLEQFLDDTKWGLGHPWFAVGSKYRIIAHDGSTIGGAIAPYWKMCGFRGIDQIVKRTGQWDGLWGVAIPELISTGT